MVSSNYSNSNYNSNYLDISRELLKLWGMKIKVPLIVIDTSGTAPKGQEKKRGGGLEKWEIACTTPIDCVFEVGQNTEKGPGNLRRLAVTPMKDHQLTLV